MDSNLINTVKALIRSGDRENIILGQELYKSEYPLYEFGFINWANESIREEELMLLDLYPILLKEYDEIYEKNTNR